MEWKFELPIEKTYWENYLRDMFIREGVDFEEVEIVNGYPLERILIMTNIKIGDFAFTQLFKETRAYHYQEKEVTEADLRI